jgi:hypothetical protein
MRLCNQLIYLLGIALSATAPELMMTNPKPTEQPDFQKLQAILEKQLGRKVSLAEAIGTGEHLLKVYAVLLN